MENGNVSFEDLFEANPAQIIVVDRYGAIVALNRAKRDSGDRLPNEGDVMYKNYASEHDIDMHSELMACIESREKRVFAERSYGDRILSITISPFSGGAIIISEDVTEQKQTEHALRARQELLNVIPAMAVQGYRITSDGDAIVTYWNEASEELYGYTKEEALGKNLLDLIIPPEIREWAAGAIKEMAETEVSIPSGELKLMRKDRSLVWVYSSHSFIKMTGREPEMFCVDVDIKDRKAMEEELRKSKEYLSALTNAAQNPIITIDSNGRVVFWNPAAEKFTGFSSEDVLGRPICEFLISEKCHGIFHIAMDRFPKGSEEISQKIDLQILHKDGSGEIPVQATLDSFASGTDQNVTLILHDVSELHKRIVTDALTDLYNHGEFHRILEKEIVRANRYRLPLTMAIFDIDDFKKFNDVYGHIIGDQVLKRVSGLIKGGLRDDVDSACRYGGEEIVVILPQTAKEDGIIVAERIRKTIEEMSIDLPDDLKAELVKEDPGFDEGDIRVTVSGGVKEYASSESKEAFFVQVDHLLLLAKKLGKNRICHD